MVERWRSIAGFEGRYVVSNLGRIKSVSFFQRYLLRNGKSALRRTKEKILATQKINSGYLIAHLHLNGKRSAKLVHRLVAAAFCKGFFAGADTNHKNGKKTDNRAANLEWVARTENHLHAVALGLNKRAIRVTDPKTKKQYDSINQAVKGAHKSRRTVSTIFKRG